MKKVVPLLICCFLATTLLAKTGNTADKDHNEKDLNLKRLENPRVAHLNSLYSGPVKNHVKLGEQVKEGQLIFEVNTDIVEIKKDYLESKLKVYQKIFDGMKKLVKNHSISSKKYQQTKRKIIDMEFEIKSLEHKMQNSKYHAPFDGTVTEIVNYDGTWLGDDSKQVEITEGKVDVKSKNTTYGINANISGIVDLKVKKGDKVEKGDLLFRTTPNILEPKKKKDLENLLYQKREFKRKKKLRKNTVSNYTYLKTKLAYKNAKKTVKIDNIKYKLHSVHAPFEGEVIKIHRHNRVAAEDGDTVVTLKKITNQN